MPQLLFFSLRALTNNSLEQSIFLLSNDLQILQTTQKTNKNIT